MRAFQYARPDRIEDALSLLKQHGSNARLLAGGTDLIVRIRSGRFRPQLVIDLKRIRSLRADPVVDDGKIRIGALTVMRGIIEDATVRRHFPALADSARVVGSVQIRNRATLAGNICNASPAADTAPVLLAYGATVNIAGSNGRRTVSLGEFFVGPGKTVLAPDELVESIDVPVPSSGTGAAFGRVTRRRGVDLATINLCCVVKPTGETVFGFGAVGPRPFCVVDKSGVLAGAADKTEKENLLQQLITSARPISDVRGSREYRMAMLMVMSRRALEQAIEKTGVNG